MKGAAKSAAISAGGTTTSQRIISIAVITVVAVKSSFLSKENLATAIRPICSGPKLIDRQNADRLEKR
jgi:hypothetical protein